MNSILRLLMLLPTLENPLERDPAGAHRKETQIKALNAATRGSWEEETYLCAGGPHAAVYLPAVYKKVRPRVCHPALHNAWFLLGIQHMFRFDLSFSLNDYV